MSVRDFALPSPRTGSIEAHSGYGPLPQQGTEIHTELQAMRAAADRSYTAEFPLTHTFLAGDLEFRVGGRVDGFFAGLLPIFEEIKSAFDAEGLVRKLRDRSDHPYRLQLATYAYIHFKATGVAPACRLTVVSSRTRAETALDFDLDVEGYERWLKDRLAELVAEESVLEARRKRRRKISKLLEFPFSTTRPGQSELMAAIAGAEPATKHLLIEAPTGMGKTLGIMLPALREALAKGSPLLYLTPKNSQHAVAEQAARQLAQPRTLTLTAKARICMKGEPVCNPEHCEFARDYYEKVAKHGLAEKVGRLRSVTEGTLRRFAREYEVCPAELALDAAPAFDVVIGDYNYVIQPHGLVTRITSKLRGKGAKPSVVVDEAHNLYARANENLSATLSLRELQRLANAADSRAPCAAVVAETAALVRRFGPATASIAVTKDLTDELAGLDARWAALTAEYLASDAEIAERDPVLALTGYWRAFYEALAQVFRAQKAAEKTGEGVGAFSCLFERGRGDELLRVVCCDASRHLAESFQPFGRVVAFSATVRPFDFYARLSGFDLAALGTHAFPSPFPRANRKVLVIPQVSTKLKDRGRDAGKIADAIQRLIAVRPGNYVAFFPSFQFLGDLAARLSVPGSDVLRQTPGMSRAETGKIIERLRSGGPPALVLAVQGGSLAEGIDYPGDQLIGAIIVGPALPSFDVPRAVLRNYYEKTYGNGDDYAYTYPAMAKVVQAAGRVIRTDTDRGLIVLMDARFVEPRYSALLPEYWYEASPKELVSGKILSDVEAFWRRAEGEGHAAD